MRLLLSALHCPKGQVAHNLTRHLELLERGREAGCDLVLFPEMSLTGYRPGAAIRLEHQAVAELTAYSTDGPAACFGLVEAGPAGSPYITQVLADNGALTAVHRKAGLGTGENDLFVAGTPSGSTVTGDVPVSMAVCAEIGTAPPYQLGSNLVLGPSAPGLNGERRSTDADWRRGFEWWRGSVLEDAKRHLRAGQWLAVSTQAGATDDEDFPGWAALVGVGGVVVAALHDWHEGTLTVDLPA